MVLAEEQTTGRGQAGWKLLSAPARTCILMSVLLFPSADLVAAGPRLDDGDRLADRALGAVATAGLVADWTGREARIKWPNDVRVDGRKIAGKILVVTRPRGQRGRAGEQLHGRLVDLDLVRGLTLELAAGPGNGANAALRHVALGSVVALQEQGTAAGERAGLNLAIPAQGSDAVGP